MIACKPFLELKTMPGILGNQLQLLQQTVEDALKAAFPVSDGSVLSSAYVPPNITNPNRIGSDLVTSFVSVDLTLRLALAPYNVAWKLRRKIKSMTEPHRRGDAGDAIQLSIPTIVANSEDGLQDVPLQILRKIVQPVLEGLQSIDPVYFLNLEKVPIGCGPQINSRCVRPLAWVAL
jgi:hypothetical protein